jgi:TonB family protein
MSFAGKTVMNIAPLASSVALALLAAGTLQAIPTQVVAAETCGLHTIEAPTHFPIRSQLRGQSGVVLIEVSVDANGRATGAQLKQSSGYRLLDRAATTSVRNDWQFDTSGCERKDLPATRTVAIDYRNDEFGG